MAADANVARARWDGKPHRKANGAGGEFSASADTEQPDALAGGVRLFEAIWMRKQLDHGVAIPAATRYMYLRRGQEWRIYSDQPRVRGQRDMEPPEVETPPPSFLSRPAAPMRRIPFRPLPANVG